MNYLVHKKPVALYMFQLLCFNRFTWQAQFGICFNRFTWQAQFGIELNSSWPYECTSLDIKAIIILCSHGQKTLAT